MRLYATTETTPEGDIRPIHMYTLEEWIEAMGATPSEYQVLLGIDIPLYVHTDAQSIAFQAKLPDGLLAVFALNFTTIRELMHVCDELLEESPAVPSLYVDDDELLEQLRGIHYNNRFTTEIHRHIMQLLPQEPTLNMVSVCRDAGLSRTYLTELALHPRSSPSRESVRRIVEYFATKGVEWSLAEAEEAAGLPASE